MEPILIDGVALSDDFDPTFADEVLFSRPGARGRVYVFKDGPIVGRSRAQAKIRAIHGESPQS